MHWSDLPFHAPPRTLRQFAALWLLFFAVLALRGWLNDRVWQTYLALGLAVGLPGLVRPTLVRPIWMAALAATFPIGWAVSRLSVVVLYFLVVTPLGVMLRLLRRDPLRLRPQPLRASYWEPRRSPEDVQSYLRQF